MMAGINVINVVQLPDSTWIQCEELGSYCAILIETNHEVKVGDELWWQGPYAMWTPKPDDGREDVRLTRLGCCHFTIPDNVLIAVTI